MATTISLWKRFGFGLTQEEREERERRRQEEIARRELYRQLAEEADYVADLIRRRLVELGICYRYKQADKRGFFKTEVKPIDFERVTATPEAHYLRVNTRSMPRGVTVADLYSEATIEALGYSIGTEVSFKASKDIGFWYVVPRKGRLGGIPRLVKYIDALAAIPQSAPTLAFPVGFGENNRFAWDDLEAVTNLLIAGSKGGGKSNALNMILATMIQRAGPADLRLFLVDLKAGMEFIYYAGIPQLGGDQPYTDEKSGELNENPFSKIMIHGGTVIKMLEYVLDEIQRRGNVLRGKAKKLSVWNKRYRKSKIPYWVIVIDELGDLMLDRRYRTKAENLLSRISQLGRAVGVHLILATQTPNKDTVPRLLKNNLDARLAFRCADGPSSQIVVDNYDASYLPKIPGRMLYVGGHHTSMDRIQVQTPFIADAMVKDIVRRVKGGEVDLSLSPEHDVTSEDLFRWALENDQGNFSYREIHKAFKKRGLTVNDILKIGQEFECEDGTHEPRIEIDDQYYHLEPAGGSAPRKLVLCALCNENPDQRGEADEGVDAVESDEEIPKDFETDEKAEKSDWSLGGWDSDKEDRDSGRDVWDSDHGESETEPDETDIDDETPDMDVDGDEEPSDTHKLSWVAADPVKGVKGELTNLQRDVIDWIAAATLWDGDFRQAVKDWKYHRDETHVELYKNILCDFFRATWPFDQMPDALIPVPLHPKRLTSRGFNQSAVLAGALSNVTGIPVVEALKRVRHTQPQVTQRDEYRGSNVDHAFETTGVEVPAIVVVIDDLITSGATISECARVLKEAGALWVGGLALARPPLNVGKKAQAQARAMPPLPPNPLPTNGDQPPSDDDFSDWIDDVVEKSMKRGK